ncbi:MAG: class D sortase [Eubacteriaceae bacterium]|nr:class D sortase [Eubacteriaceae bacterium]
MTNNHRSSKKHHKKSRLGILIGIPLFLFVTGIMLITIAGFNYFKYAFYLSSLFIHDESSLIAQSEDVGADVIYPRFGQKYGEIIIESAEIKAPVYCGDSDEILLKGVGQFYGSKFPGEGGNTVLAGHRNSVFKKLGKVKLGDKVVINTNYGLFTYEITDIRITDGNDQSIIQPLDRDALTMYTCYPFEFIGNAPNRYVVTCDLVERTSLGLGEEGE